MKLFQDFDPVSSKEWKQQIQFEQKGADYNDLVWESPEGIKVRPFYHVDDYKKSVGVENSTEPFLICQDIFVYDVAKSVTRAKDFIARGAESIRFTVENPDTDFNALLSDLPLDKVAAYIKMDFLSEEILTKINHIATQKNFKIFCLTDPVGQLAKAGNWFASSEKNNFEIFNKFAIVNPNITYINVDAGLYQNAGANTVQQVAYAMAHVNEYFTNVENPGKTVVFEVSIGSNYFFEIAKLRAMRQLFAAIVAEYDFEVACHILATPSKRNKTLYDYNVNMLRTTTECMSAILGNADAVSNLAYDSLYHKSNEFGERISRNQLLVMKHESYLDKVGNPASGSYYIETLTSQIAEKALLLFKEIEENHGFIKQLAAGTIQRKIRESAEKEQKLFDDGNEVLLGTNKYPNPNDHMSTDLELFPFVKINPRKTLITPIIEKRLSEKLEQNRLEAEAAKL